MQEKSTIDSGPVSLTQVKSSPAKTMEKITWLTLWQKLKDTVKKKVKKND